MDRQDPCPFCGTFAELQDGTFADAFQNNGAGNSDIVTPNGIVGFPKNSNPNSYYRCSMCAIDYVKETLEVDEIVKNLFGNRNVGMLLNYYYGDIPIKELFTKDNVRLFRKPPNAYSFVSKAKSEKQIFFVLTYNGKKTSGTILKTGKKVYKLSDLEEI